MSSYDNRMVLGWWHIGTLKRGDYRSLKFFTVHDGEELHIYEHPYGESKRDIRNAIHVAFVEEQSDEYKIVGRYPNYHVVEKQT
jgi:hypothetical protein